ncbi:MAG: alcohol dehydrogenase catalytic domain-containing protein [Deltaproteobacteria bacterium]|nr:MAG: alcohol dehydrogenase catalytic domain-containing protein [Deltaproteobacteria bacterium]
MKAVVYHGARDFRYEDAADPALESPGDALVRVTRSAICGSDLHLWNGLPIPDRGFAVGHEFVGVVEAVGAGVQSVRRGDRVFASCTLGCGTCESCRRGLMSGCAVTTAGGTRNNVFGFSAAYAGGQAEAVRVPFADANLFPIPEALSDEQALFLTDILPTADMACELAAVEPGDRVVVIGSGPVGSLVQSCARVRGAARVIAVDLDDARLLRAQERGCEVVHPGRENLAERVLELSDGRGADAVIEAVGRPELVSAALGLLRAGGRLAVVGVLFAPVEIPWALVFMKNLTLRSGLVNPQRHVSRLIPLVEQGRLDPTELITHRLPLSEAAKGYEIFAERRDGVLKVVLQP